MNPSQRNRLANKQSHRRSFSKKCKNSVRLFIEELETRAVPSISASGTTITATEGMGFNGVVATFTDTDVGATINNFTTLIAWGDGTTSVGTVEATNTGFQVTGSHAYADEGSPSVSVTINDIDGSSATATTTTQVADNDALTATSYGLSGVEGQAVDGIVATFTDVTYPTNSPDDFTANITWGDGTNSDGTVTSQNGLFVVRGSHTYAEKGSYSISVGIKDDGSGVAFASTSSTANIADAALTASGTPVSALEGQIFNDQVVATFSDANLSSTAADFTATIDWGNGVTTQGGITSLGNGNFEVFGPPTGFMVTPTIYREEGSFTVTTTINDIDGSQAIVTSTASVADAPLSARGTPVHAAEGVTFSGQVATFTDANPLADLSDFQSTAVVPGGGSLVSIHWGDGSISNASVTQPNGIGSPFVVSGGHTYAKAGSYAISVSIFDNGGNTATTTTTATVTDLTDIVGRDLQTGEWWVGVSNGSGFDNVAFGNWNPKATWADVRTGDFNGDGLTDIAGLDLQTGQWWVSVASSSQGGPAAFREFFSTSMWAGWNPKATWADVRVGDFNGDGKADLAAREADTGQWWVAISTGSSFTTSLWTQWNPNVTWVDVQVGDFTGDGKADLAGRVLQTGQWWVAQSTGSSFNNSLWATWSPNVTWVDVMTGDFDGDGKMDLTGRVRENGQWWTALSNGSTFSSNLWATWSTAVTWVDVNVGDFNGDGKADIIGRALETGQWWVGLSIFEPGVCIPDPCTEDMVGFATSLWATWSPSVTWVDVKVGDFNGDGKSDITGRVLEAGQWWTGLSTGSSLTTSLWGAWSTATSWLDVNSGRFDSTPNPNIV